MTSEFFTEKEKKILELELRRNVYQLVSRYAGAHFRELERQSGLATGSIQYHLNYLRKRGLIKAERANKTRYFPREFKPENMGVMAFLRQKSIRDIILCVLLHEGCSHEQIAMFAQLSPSTVSWHLKKLEQAHVIGTAKKGRKTGYSIVIDKNEIVNLLIIYRGSFFDSLVDNVIGMWDMD